MFVNFTLIAVALVVRNSARGFPRRGQVQLYQCQQKRFLSYFFVHGRVARRGRNEIPLHARMTHHDIVRPASHPKFFARFVDVYTAGVHEIQGSREARGFQQDSVMISRVIFAI